MIICIILYLFVHVIFAYIYAMLIMYKNCTILGQNKCNSFFLSYDEVKRQNILSSSIINSKIYLTFLP